MMGSKSGLIESTNMNNNCHSLSNSKKVEGIFSLRVWLCPTLPYMILGQYKFNRLRAICVSRLTLFNARRGGEPARLLLKEW